MISKFILIIINICMLFTFYVPWFGARGIVELGVVDLFSISGWFFVMYVISCLGIFAESKNVKVFSMLGIVGILLLAIYEFFMWHYLTVTGRIDVLFSLDMTFPEFYISVLIFIINIVLRNYYIKKDASLSHKG